MDKTKKSVRGIIISTLFLVVQMFFSFWKTKLIITVYGTDINSVTQTANQIYAYFSLLEGGLCAAYQFKMYEPFVNGNYSALYSLYKSLSRAMYRVGLKMILIILFVSFFYPLILASNELSHLRSGFIFFLVGIRCVLPFCIIVAKKNVIIIDEKQYIISSIDSLASILTIIIEIIFAKYLGAPIEATLIGGCIITLLSFFFYKFYVNDFWIEKNIYQEDTKYKNLSIEADSMTKDILVHQFSGLANNNIDILILSACDIFAVTVYSNYNSIINYPVQIINGGIKNLRATIGLKFASDSLNSYTIFRELLCFNIWCAGIVTAVFETVINDFIYVWLGSKFLIDKMCIILFSLILLRKLVAEVVYSVRDANGLYKESKYYTLITAITNLFLSLILSRLMGIKGLLLGTVISAYVIMDFGNNYLVFKKVFNKKLFIYVDLILLFVAVGITDIIFNNMFEVISWRTFFLKTIIVTIFAIIIITITLLICDSYMKKLLFRLKKIIK